MNKSKDMNKKSDAVSHFYPEYHAGGFTRVDGTVEFYTCVNSHKRALRTLKGKVNKVIGLDIDHAVKESSLLNEAAVVLPDSRPLWSLMLGLFRVCSCLEVCGAFLFVFLRVNDLVDLVPESDMTTDMENRPSIPCALKAAGVEDNALTMRTGKVQNG
jgi:hypothetical protein